MDNEQEAAYSFPPEREQFYDALDDLVSGSVVCVWIRRAIYVCVYMGAHWHDR